MISSSDYLFFVDDALGGMVSIVTQLGDDGANRRLEVDGSNSPYAILNHCLGVMEFWGGQAVAGRTIERDRAAEFTASGPVDELVARAGVAQSQLREDIAGVEPAAPLRGVVSSKDKEVPSGKSQGGALIHLYRELAQHRGQMEITRDLILADWAKLD
jgi:Protein of unknown function (DUF664)